MDDNMERLRTNQCKSQPLVNNEQQRCCVPSSLITTLQTDIICFASVASVPKPNENSRLCHANCTPNLHQSVGVNIKYQCTVFFFTGSIIICVFHTGFVCTRLDDGVETIVSMIFSLIEWKWKLNIISSGNWAQSERLNKIPYGKVMFDAIDIFPRLLLTKHIQHIHSNITNTRTRAVFRTNCLFITQSFKFCWLFRWLSARVSFDSGVLFGVFFSLGSFIFGRAIVIVVHAFRFFCTHRCRRKRIGRAEHVNRFELHI